MLLTLPTLLYGEPAVQQVPDVVERWRRDPDEKAGTMTPATKMST